MMVMHEPHGANLGANLVVVLNSVATMAPGELAAQLYLPTHDKKIKQKPWEPTN